MQNKTCAKCHQEKSLKFFSKSSGRKDGLQTYCKECNGEECRQRYSQNKERHKEKTSIRKNKSKQENRRNAYQYLSKHPCVDCGEIDARCLEFDHVRGEKKNNISSMMKNVCAWETILEEISKCDVRCANCHRKRTSDVQGWYKSL